MQWMGVGLLARRARAEEGGEAAHGHRIALLPRGARGARLLRRAPARLASARARLRRHLARHALRARRLRRVLRRFGDTFRRGMCD
jgi:hypothetical protein